MNSYDEGDLHARLAPLGRHAKTAFAAACTELLLPSFERYAQVAGTDDAVERLRIVVDATWNVAGGGDVELEPYQAEAEGMVPSSDDGAFVEIGYGEHAATAAAYAVRTWLTDDPQEAAWAARQVYEVADYAVLQSRPELDLNDPESEARIVASPMVQGALAAIEDALATVESGPATWGQLREDVDAAGRTWCATLP